MEFVAADVFATLLGWIYLFLRYRTKEKRKAILEVEYEGSYASIAYLKSLQLFAIILLTALLGLFLFVLYSTASQAIHWLL